MEIENLDVVNNQGEKKRRLRKGPNKKWNDFQLSVLLDFLKNNRKFEKPTAQIYYRRFLKECGNIVNAEWSLVRFKVRNLKTSYTKAKSWKQSAGAGTLQEGQLITDVLHKMCPNYDDLEEIFGCRKVVFQPITVDTEINDYADSLLSPTTSTETEDLLSRNLTPTPNEDLPSTSCGKIASSSNKGIYSQTVVGDSLKVYRYCGIKKKKFDADDERMEKEINITEKELLIREREIKLNEEKHRLNEIRVTKELELKEKEIENEQIFFLRELEMKERIALQKLEMKERIAMKTLENKM